ncbi:MAG: transcription antitermination protein NusB [Bacteroidota bacterium]
MQVLYGMSRDKELTQTEVVKRYNDAVQNSFELYIFNLYYLTQIAAYSNNDAARRSAKHLPSEEDKIFTPRLFENPIIQSLTNYEALEKEFLRYKMPGFVDEDNIRKLYVEFSKTKDYTVYFMKEECEGSDHRDILLKLYKHCSTNELYNELIEERFPSWVDDKSLIVGTMKKTLKQLPDAPEFLDSYRPPFDTTTEFGEGLLVHVIEKDSELLEMIEPTLKNWDAERVAVLDMILIKMALSELIIFPTIPTKVTLNEFVEISKMYSTDKSKDFINGILDRLMKKLNKEGKIKKEGRGLLE